MNKLANLLNLFRKGAAVSEPAAWKQRQITASMLGALIMAVVGVLGAYGYVLPIDNETALAIAGGILAVINTVLTITTSDKVGFGSGIQQSDSGSEGRTEPVLEQPAPAGEAGIQVEQRSNVQTKQHESRSENFYQN